MSVQQVCLIVHECWSQMPTLAHADPTTNSAGPRRTPGLYVLLLGVVVVPAFWLAEVCAPAAIRCCSVHEVLAAVAGHAAVDGIRTCSDPNVCVFQVVFSKMQHRELQDTGIHIEPVRLSLLLLLSRPFVDRKQLWAGLHVCPLEFKM